MCKLKFDYQKEQISNDLKSAFEKRVKAQYGSLCEDINSTGGVRVSTGPNGKLRGLIFADRDLIGELKRHGLTPNIE